MRGSGGGKELFVGLHVSVDFGSSSTCTVVSVDGGEPQVVVIDGQPLVPSAVFAATDGTLFVGQEAERHAALDPSRFEPHPKRRIDEGELLLGTSVLAVSDVIRAVLRRVVDEARRYGGGAPVDVLVLTHPADWGSTRVAELRRAAHQLGREIALVPEPVAAAVFHSSGQGVSDGDVLAVLDLGGGTVDASVVGKQGHSFQVLATRGNPNFGGADIDQALLDHLGGVVSGTDEQAWTRLVDGRDMPDRRRRRVLNQDVRGAKETLSRYTYTDIPMPPPFSDAHVTRADLERLIAEPLGRSAELVQTTLHEAAAGQRRLAGVFLVGGSSRIPLIARLIHERTGIVPTTLDQPETVVARGALRAVRLEAEPPADTGFRQSAPTTPARPFPPVSGIPAGHGRPGSMPSVPFAPGTPPSGGPVGAGARAGTPPQPGPGRPIGDSLSGASTVVMGGNDPTRTVGAPQKPTRKPSVGAWLVGAAGVFIVGCGLVIMTLLSGNDGDPPQHVSAYRYSFDYPSDWQQIGGNTERWETMVGPDRDGSDRLAVLQGNLGYDTVAGRQRAVSELRQQYEQEIGAGKNFSGFQDSVRFAGRDVAAYRETLNDSTVNWYVIHQGRFRVSVGCQYTSDSVEEVMNACRQVVRSLRIG